MAAKGNRNRAKGRDYERSVFNYLSSFFQHSWNVFQQNRSGYDGDDLLLHFGRHQISVECKNAQTMKLSAWVDQAKGQAAGIKPCVVVHKRKGKGSVAEHYVTMTASDFCEILTWVDEP